MKKTTVWTTAAAALLSVNAFSMKFSQVKINTACVNLTIPKFQDHKLAEQMNLELIKHIYRDLIIDCESNTTTNIISKVSQVENQLLSVVFEVSSYTQGAPHPDSIVKPFNYSIKDNKPTNMAHLRSMLNSKSKIKLFNDAIIKSISAEDKEALGVNSGHDFLNEANLDFYFNEAGDFVFVNLFSQHAIANYETTVKNAVVSGATKGTYVGVR